MPPPLATLLDGSQVLQHAFEEPIGAIRTTAIATVVGGDLSVDTDHTEDSIRLGDGTSFLSSTTVGPKIGLDVNIINAALEIAIDHDTDSIQIYGTDGSVDRQIKTDTQGRLEIVPTDPNTPEIFNISVPLAGTEASQVLPSGTKRFLIRSRDSASSMQLAFSSGQTNINFLRINRGSVYESPSIDGSGLTLFFQTNQPNTIVEIIAWKLV